MLMMVREKERLLLSSVIVYPTWGGWRTWVMVQGPRHATMCLARRPVASSWVWVGGTYIFTLSPTAKVAGIPCLFNLSCVVVCMKVLCACASLVNAVVDTRRFSAKSSWSSSSSSMSRKVGSSSWLREGAKGETGGVPWSSSKGQVPPMLSWQTVL